MKVNVRCAIVKCNPDFHSCTIDINGMWFPVFVPDRFLNDVVVCDTADIEIVFKCKFAKGSKPFVYLVLNGFEMIDIS